MLLNTLPQLGTRYFDHLGIMGLDIISSHSSFSMISEKRQDLLFQLEEATSQTQWEQIARSLDQLDRSDEWQSDTTDANATDWNPQRIQIETKRFEAARESGDVDELLHLIRSSLSRDLGGMGNPSLYRHSYLATKKLIENYVDTVVQAIDAISDLALEELPGHLPLQSITRTIQQARQNYGRSALLLSGGGTCGMLHIGVLKALHEADLLPRIISGASAGSIVCALLCSLSDAEIPQMLKEFAYGHLDVFEHSDSKIGFFGHLIRLLFQGSWNDVGNLDRVMRGLVGDITFREAHNKSGRVLNICLSTPSSHDMPRILNYLTAPHVLVRTAVTASCSVPLVFEPGKLSVKNPMTGEIQVWEPGSQTWVDGSLDNDLPIERLSEMFNVNHFIVSQVNPHIVPFIPREDHIPSKHDPAAKVPLGIDAGRVTDINHIVGNVAIMEAIHRLQVMADVGLAPGYASKLRSVLSQKYSGNINILPRIDPKDLPVLLSNPTVDFMLRTCLTGERATWPKISRIRERVAIETALSRCLRSLKARVVALNGLSHSTMASTRHNHSPGRPLIHKPKKLPLYLGLETITSNEFRPHTQTLSAASSRRPRSLSEFHTSHVWRQLH